MCFSGEVDLLAGAGITALGVDAVRHASSRRDVPLAVVPIVLGGHLLVEAVVWHGLQGGDALLGWRTAAALYLAIAFVVVPVLVPFALIIREPEPRRRQLLPFLVVGAGVATVLGLELVEGPISARIEDHHIAYSVPLASGGLLVAIYVASTCGSALLSTDAAVRAFGWANLLAVAVLVWFEKTALISLWCAWAAVASAVIVVHFRRRATRSEVARSGRPELIERR